MKRQYDVKFIPQQKIKEMYNELKQPEISSNLQTRPLLGQKASQITKKTLDDAMKELKTEDRRNQYKDLINSGEIKEVFDERENRRINATTLQSALRKRRAKQNYIAANSKFNPEEYQKKLRKKLKAFQS